MYAFCISMGLVPVLPSKNSKYNPTNKYIKAVPDLDKIMDLIGKGEDMNGLDKKRGLSSLHFIAESINCLNFFDDCYLISREESVYNEDENKKIRDELIYRYYKAAELLLDNGANVDVKDKDGNTALRYCSDVKCIKFFLQYGADINARNLAGETLIFSSELNKDVIELMIKNGADVNVKNFKGETALFYERNPKRVRLLVKYKIKVNEQNNEGKTVLHYILSEKNPSYKLILELLKSGAEVDIKDKNGITPLDIAFKNSEIYTTKIFKEIYGAMLKYK